MAPARLRGAAVCFVQVSYQLGVFIAFWVSLGTTQIPGGGAWRTLTAIQVVFGLVLIVNALLAPESPRLLLSNSQSPSDDFTPAVDSARKNLARIRRLDIDDPSLVQEWRELQDDAVLRREQASRYALRSLVRQRNAWRRLAIGGGSAILAQLTGVAALMLYGITVFQSLNLGSDTVSLLINGVGGSLQLVACFFPVFFVDRLGRRFIMMLGPAISAIAYLFLAALFERWPDASNRGAGIWMIICIFAIQCSYAGALGSVAILIAAEIWPQPLRDFGVSVSLLCLFLAVIVVNQLWPVLSAAITHRLYWLLMAINVLSFVSGRNYR